MATTQHRKDYIKKYSKTEKFISYQKKYRSEHKKEFAFGQRKYQRRLRDSLLALLGNKCIVCGISDRRVLQVDHVNGGGRKEYTKIHPRGQYHKYLIDRILSGSEEYQLLCANCNWIKRHENQEYY